MLQGEQMGGEIDSSKKKPSLHSEQVRDGVAVHSLQLAKLIEHDSQIFVVEFG